MTDPFVVIGGDAAGLSAASKLKREAPDRAAIVFEKGEWVSYAHCGMPYYIKGEVEALEDLLSLSPAEIDERGIDLRRRHEVIGIDPDARTVTVDGPDETFEQPYGELLIGTGARALTSPIAGTDLDGVFTLHHMDAAAAVRAYLTEPTAIDPATVDGPYVDRALVEKYADRQPPETAAIVGGGYVGIEMAEALAGRGLDVTLFQRSEHVLPPFGSAVAEEIEAHLTERGVTVHTETPVEALVGNGDGTVDAVEHAGGRTPIELAIVGIGIRPNTDFLEGTGIELGDSGAVRIDAYGRTSRSDIYAAGDCAEMPHAVTGDPAWVPLGLTANRAGRAIGSTVAGTPEPVGEIAGTAVVKAFELEAGRTGLATEQQAREAGFDPVSATITAGSRSGYYPGAEPTTVTLIADRSTERLLGGSIVGKDRAAIRIDILTMAVQSGVTVAELERRDLAYAPPFSPVWDPVLVGAKVLNGDLD
ncbi:MAG: FAD-dependent oxidoreductase [Halobacteriales archaeon]